MTRPDFLNAIRRYAERQERANIKTDTVDRNQAVLRDFLREVELDVERDPDLFQHPELYATLSTPYADPSAPVPPKEDPHAPR